MMANTNTRWTYADGKKGKNRVRVFEDPETGVIYMEWYVGRQRRSKSLRHRDRGKAEVQARRAADEFASLVANPGPEPEEPMEHPLTIGMLFDKYFESPKARRKSPAKRKHDGAAKEMFCRYFGLDTLVESLDEDDFDSFVDDRRGGQIAPGGEVRGEPVKDRAIEYDLRFLRSVLRWATSKKTGGNGRLLMANPMDGFPIPTEANPNRPILYDEEYQSLLAVAHDVEWRFAVALVLANETGHRIGAIRMLTWSDVDLSSGWIRWRTENDKVNWEHSTRMTPPARRALEEARAQSPGEGEAPVLPSPKNPSVPVSRHLVRDWWRKAEELSGIDRVHGRGWHSLRRKFATELKTEPLPDVRELGGWKTEETLLRCYQQADPESMDQAQKRRKPLRRASSS